MVFQHEKTWHYKTDYLLRTAITKFGLGANNISQEQHLQI